METDYSAIFSAARTPNKYRDGIARGDEATCEISDIDSSGTIMAVGNTIDSPAGPQTLKPREVSLEYTWVQLLARRRSIKHIGVPLDEDCFQLAAWSQVMRAAISIVCVGSDPEGGQLHLFEGCADRTTSGRVEKLQLLKGLP